MWSSRDKSYHSVFKESEGGQNTVEFNKKKDQI